jgi:hypothetical protein
MAEDKGKSGSAGGFGADMPGVGKPEGGKTDKLFGGKPEGGKHDKPFAGKPADKPNTGKVLNEMKRDVFKQEIKPGQEIKRGGGFHGAEGGVGGHKRHRHRRRGKKSGFEGDPFQQGATDVGRVESGREQVRASGFAGGEVRKGHENMNGGKKVENGKVGLNKIVRDEGVADVKKEENVKAEVGKEHERIVRADGVGAGGTKDVEDHEKAVRDEHEKAAEAVKPIEPESPPPELPVAPINPFSSDLPPMAYETRYSDQGWDKDKKGEKQGEVVSRDESTKKFEPIDTEIPVNPFETSIFPAKPLDDKPLVDRPLEEKKKVEELEADEKSSKKSFDDIKEDFSVKETELWSASMPEVSVAGEKPIVAEVVDRKKSFVAEPATVDMPEVKAVDSKGDRDEKIEEFKSEFFKVLESAGITKGKIVVFASFFVVAVIALLFFVFGWYKVFIFWGDEAGETGKEVSEVSETGGVLPDDSSGNIFGIVSSYIFGLEYQPAVENIIAEPITTWGSISGLTASFVFGEVGDFKKHRFSEYAELIRSLKNISETDVYKLLDLAVDRRAALVDHLNLMKEFIGKAESTSVFIESEIERVRAEYMLLNDQRAVYEEQFFAEVQAMNGDSAYNSMEKFVDSSQQVVALKAYFSANQSILKLVNDYKNILGPRYEDISVNSEALIKGVKVFEIPQSNIDAIIILP